MANNKIDLFIEVATIIFKRLTENYGYIFLPPSLDVIDGKRVLNYCFQFHKIKTL